MLVLSRKKGETIHCLESGIVITIADLDRGKVRIGIEAPPTETIARGELLQNGRWRGTKGAKSNGG